MEFKPGNLVSVDYKNPELLFKVKNTFNVIVYDLEEWAQGVGLNEPGTVMPGVNRLHAYIRFTHPNGDHWFKWVPKSLLKPYLTPETEKVFGDILRDL